MGTNAGESRPLSPREREICALSDAGRTSKEIAFQLGIAPATVRVLQARARKKLGPPTSAPPRTPEPPES